MRKVIGAAFVSVDGVMQAPGGPTEDPTGGFDFGGWVAPFFDEQSGGFIERLFTPPFDLLLGWRTYDIFAGYWPYAEGDEASMGRRFDACTKYVLTHRDGLPWRNSERLPDLEALRALKAGDGPDLIIQGSSTLYPQLLAEGLLDRLTVLTFPLVLGGGKRLFGDGTPPGALRVTDRQATPNGVLITTYEPAGPVPTGDFGQGDPSPHERDRQARMARGAW